MKDIKWIGIIIAALLLISALIFILRKSYVSKEYNENYLNDSYAGIIEEIKYEERKRGCPDIKIQGKWFHMGFDAEISASFYIEIGDSIVKKKNDLNIYLYKKKNNGIWDMKIFEPRFK